MKRSNITKAMRVLVGLVAAISASNALAQSCEMSEEERTRFATEHLYGGQPTPGSTLVRRGYVAQYDEERRVPRWVAWHALRTYQAHVPREARWSRFRRDESISEPVVANDYNGIYDNGDGYARGHFMPYFMSGGDRDGDGLPPYYDSDDACTVFEINYMTNIAPQLHNRFNGSGGLWYAVESFERKIILTRGHTLHMIAGSIFGDNPETVGPDDDIGIPDMFYRLLITRHGVVPFLFVHMRRLDPAGCDLEAELVDCIVTVADIERVAGADFFNALPDSIEAALEATDGRAEWARLTVQD